MPLETRSNRRGLEFLDEFFKGKRATEIDAEFIRRYVSHRRKVLSKNDPEDVEIDHDPTIRRELVTLRAMFNQAKKEGKLGQGDVPHFPMPKDSEPAGQYIDPQTFQKILDALPTTDQRPFAE